MQPRERFLAACRCHEVDRPPIWLMRQAGRYLPEYQELRRAHSFWEMVRTPSLAIEATLQPIRRYGFDASIVFSDILTVLDAMGATVSFDNGGPKLSRCLRSEADLSWFGPGAIQEKLGYVGEAVAGLCAALHPQTAVIGFAGAPFTLAAYLVEGGASNELPRLKAMAYGQPELYHRVLEMIADSVAELLLLQIDAGADAVQIFDTWAGKLSPGDYRALALPYVQQVVRRLQPRGLPVVLYSRGAAANVELAAQSGAQVLSLDISLDPGPARERVGAALALQGNLDPAELFGPLDRLRARARELLAQTGGRGHIVNLGAGLLPETPVEAVGALVETVKEWRP